MIKPLGNRVLLSPIKPKLMSDGGLHIVEQYQDDRMQWIIEAVGPKVTELQVGDRVLTPLYFDHFTCPDGKKIVDAKQLIMVWGSRFAEAATNS